MNWSPYSSLGGVPVIRPSPPASYKITLYAILAILLGLLLYRGFPALVARRNPPVELIVYGFSTQEEVFTQEIFPAFEAKWEAKSERDLQIESVFGPSGTLANQILLGAPADVAVFSNAQHVNWLRVGRMVEPETRAEIIGSTPMVIVTRPGNPQRIREFTDLSQTGLRLLHPEPGRSGAGDWAVLAEYGSAYIAGADREAATRRLKAIWHNVHVLGSSARATMNLYELGAGDALVTYEQDALLASYRGVPLEIVVPSRTIVAQHLVVVVDANTNSAERAVARDFARFLMSDDGQKILSRHHLRTAVSESADFAEITHAFTIDDLGGWSHAYRLLIEGIWMNEIAPQLDRESVPKLADNGD